MFNISGTLKVKGKEQNVSDKFKKREFVLTENSSQYRAIRCGSISVCVAANGPARKMN